MSEQKPREFWIYKSIGAGLDVIFDEEDQAAAEVYSNDGIIHVIEYRAVKELQDSLIQSSILLADQRTKYQELLQLTEMMREALKYYDDILAEPEVLYAIDRPRVNYKSAGDSPKERFYVTGNISRIAISKYDAAMKGMK